MNLASPKMLWLLLLIVPGLIGFLWWSWRKRQELITQFISERLLGHLKVGVSPSRQKARMALLVLAVIFLILALARPQWGVIREEAHQRGLDIIMAIDTSNSMLAEDVSPNRLTRAKLAALDLMRRAKTDRLGLIAFAGDAFLECPLTLDDAAFSQSVNALDTKTISQGGTAIGSAINEARSAFKKETDNHKVLVLFTDGEDHDSDAIEAAKKAAKEGMIIFTVGIGTTEGELLRIRDERGRVDYIRDENGKPVKSSLDEEFLQQIASITKGFYRHLVGTKTMDTLYDSGLAPLPKTDTASRMFQHRREQFHWPLVIAIALLIAEIFLPDRKHRRQKTAQPNSQTASPVLETAAIVILLMVPVMAYGSPGSALREYKEGKYDEALKDYDKLLQNKENDPRLHFNAGTAAYQSHQLDKAAQEFTDALASPDLQLQQRAYYNLGNTMFRAGQQIQDASKKQEAWEKALQNYDSASKLNPQDADAKFNHEFVTKQLEELKKQQQQQSQQNKNQDKKQDQKNSQQQQNSGGKNDQNQQQQDKDQSQQNQRQNSQDKNQQDQKSAQQKEQDKQKQDQQSQGQQDQKQQQQSQADKQKQDADKGQQGSQNQANQGKVKSSEEAQQEAAMMAAGQMTPQQAKQLLDAQKDDERVFQVAPPNKNTLQQRTYKNW